MPDEEQELKPKRKISEKSTKQELWDAYNRALAQTEKEPVAVELTQKETSTNDSFKQLADLKLKISQQLDVAGEELLNDLNELFQTRNTISREKRRLVEHFQQQKEDLTKEINKVKKVWVEQIQIEREEYTRAQKAKETIAKRQDEEYQYNLLLKRRDEDDEYHRLKAERERKLKEQEEFLNAKEEELKTNTSKLIAETNKTKENLFKELTEKHNLKVRELTLDFEREKKIYELKITNLENTIKTQGLENESLKRQLENASRQLKEMAVAVIESRSAEKIPPEEKTEKK